LAFWEDKGIDLTAKVVRCGTYMDVWPARKGEKIRGETCSEHKRSVAEAR